MSLSGIRTIMNPKYVGPMNVFLDGSEKQMELLGPDEKHWYIGGSRSVATAVTLLSRGEIIAFPTDTVYGFAGSIDNDKAIKRLYEIKKRDEQKPLAICVSNVKDIEEWGVIDYVPSNLIETLLPGPYTIVLERTKKLNPALNPGVNNVGIRVSRDKFVGSVARLAGPLALTSANESNKPSSVHPEEFSNLWPELGGIFYKTTKKGYTHPGSRQSSTVIDLSRPGYYKILRKGVNADLCTKTLYSYGLKPYND